ncbi:MAG: DUF2007 domain-containing protein [SAR324 cluster bacterium]|nr:DUF2007 domain-containing protein [SAR324 cluster bacterium]
MDTEKTVIRTFSNEIIARIASAHLEAQGIDSTVHKDDCGGAYPQLQMSIGVHLLVAHHDLERAEAILQEVENNPT